MTQQKEPVPSRKIAAKARGFLIGRAQEGAHETTFGGSFLLGDLRHGWAAVTKPCCPWGGRERF